MLNVDTHVVKVAIAQNKFWHDYLSRLEIQMGNPAIPLLRADKSAEFIYQQVCFLLSLSFILKFVLDLCLRRGLQHMQREAGDDGVSGDELCHGPHNDEKLHRSVLRTSFLFSYHSHRA